MGVEAGVVAATGIGVGDSFDTAIWEAIPSALGTSVELFPEGVAGAAVGTPVADRGKSSSLAIG